MRVLHVIEDLGIGGAERLLVTLLPRLRAAGAIVEVAALGHRRDSAVDLERTGIRVVQFALASPRKPVAAGARLFRLLREHGHDLVHTHLAGANVAGRVAAALARVPVTTTYHACDYEPEVLRENPRLTRWKQLAYQVADRATATTCSQVIAVSDEVARSIRRRLGFRPEEVRVIRNGVSLEYFALITEARRGQCRRDLGLAPDALVVVQIGRLNPEKGPLHGLRATAALQDLERLVWVWVGDGPMKHQVEREAAAAGLRERFRLVGAHSDVRPFLQAADVFVLTSLSEGLGIAAVEAMATGLPVVAYRVGPLPEVVAHQETGILVPLGEVTDLAAAVRTLLTDRALARRMGGLARSRAETRFNAEVNAQSHLEFYRGILHRA